ncbi:SurA N-terminal domain-containing protein [Mucilaginibacter puniceus]
MAVMGYLRERMGKIVAFVIGLSLFAFVVSEVISSGGSFFKEDSNELGQVEDQKILYDEFSQSVEQGLEQFKQSGQGASPQITAYVQENTWNQTVNRLLINKQVEKLGLKVGVNETQAMISGSNPSPQIVQAFTDPQTGKFDRANLLLAIQNINTLKADDPQRVQWTNFITNLIRSKEGEKYIALVTNGIYVNSLEAKDDYEAKNKLVNFKYTSLDYASIPDSKVTLTDADYSNYYDEHKTQFKNQEELRDIEYVTFNAAPSKEDSLAVKEQVAKLIPALQASTNDSLFVQINAESKLPVVFVGKGKLADPKLDSVMFNVAPGTIYGPYQSNGRYSIAKLVAAHMSPDSVSAKHILIDPSIEGGVDKALAKADSIKKVIQGGKSFADMASMYSTDRQSALKGGDLGTFGRGAMIPAFEEPVFNGKPGEYKIVTTQYGVHLILIGSQKGSSKVVKVAVVDKLLTPSSKTQSAAYSKAQAFLVSLDDDNFDQQANKAGLKKEIAENITGVAASLPGLTGARDVIRWAFKAEKGDVSEQVFTVDDQYVVARLAGVKPKGILALDVIKKQIEPEVRNKVKARMLTEKFNAALKGSSSIDQVAQKAGSKVVPVQNIVFANPILPGVSAEYKLIGTVFGSQPNKLSKVVEGQQGVYVFVVDSFINPAPLNNSVRERQQIAQSLLQRAESQVFEALKDKANVKDNRAKFL